MLFFKVKKQKRRPEKTPFNGIEARCWLLKISVRA